MTFIEKLSNSDIAKFLKSIDTKFYDDKFLIKSDFKSPEPFLMVAVDRKPLTNDEINNHFNIKYPYDVLILSDFTACYAFDCKASTLTNINDKWHDFMGHKFEELYGKEFTKACDEYNKTSKKHEEIEEK